MPADAPDVLRLLLRLDASVVLLQPVVNENNTIIDAAVLWVNDRAESVWGDRAKMLASEVCPDFDEWLAAANGAWRGVPVRRLIEADHGRVGWRRAVSTVSRVDDHLAEVTIDRSADQELIDRLAVLDRQYRDLIAEMPVTVLSSRIDRDELDFVSPRAAELTGRPLSELTRRSEWRALVHSDDHRDLDTISDVLILGGEADVVGRIVRPDGTTRRVEARAVLTEPGIDGIGRFLLTMLDVTEHYEAQQRAEQSERLEGLARTAGGFAHEFSSLLQIIGGNLERLQGSTSAPSAPLQQSLDAVARAGALVKGLMSFASSRPGHIEPVSIPKMCQAMHAVLQDRLPQGVDLTVDLAEGLPEVMIAGESLSVVMLQIIDNAAAALSAGGVVHIEVREVADVHCHLAHHPDDRRWIRIAVSDNGCGIEADRLRKVWEPFHTTRDGVAARGAGLGLSVVHGVIHQFDGHLTLQSSPGVGTTVTLFLPAAVA